MQMADWICPKCKYPNHGSRSSCRGWNCNYYNNTDSSVQMKPGDWKCKCGEHNFAKNAVCRNCKSEKMQSSDVVLQSLLNLFGMFYFITFISTQTLFIKIMLCLLLL